MVFLTGECERGSNHPSLAAALSHNSPKNEKAEELGAPEWSNLSHSVAPTRNMKFLPPNAIPAGYRRQPDSSCCLPISSAFWSSIYSHLTGAHVTQCGVAEKYYLLIWPGRPHCRQSCLITLHERGPLFPNESTSCGREIVPSLSKAQPVYFVIADCQK